MEQILIYFDYFGVASFSITGALLASKKRFDIFGVLLISFFTAIGGGTVRDLLLNNHPVFWMTDYMYLLIIFFSSILTWIIYNWLCKFNNILKIFDAIGLAVFTIIGINISLKSGSHHHIAVLMGLITAVFGGFLRDIICNEIPLILQKEIYATASLLGGLIFYFLRNWEINQGFSSLFSILIIIFIRLIAIKFNLSLPKIADR